jgi:putative methyltransferase
MKNLYILELSDKYGNQVRLPYSTGLIWSYCKTFDKIENNYKLSEWFYYKDNIEKIIEKIINPDVIIFSCYVWNWEYNKKIAKFIKEKYPNCLTVCGGPHVPHSDQFAFSSNKKSPYWKYSLNEWFNKHPYFDIISSGEGETTISEILIENLNEKKTFENISGLIINDNEKFNLTPFKERIKEINDMPSPYLDGTFDYIIERDKKFDFTATIETTRGCPFHCAFCDQGHEYFNKLSLLSIEKIKKEIEWISKNKIIYVDNADSNFGMFFERDKQIANFLVDCKLKTGYPQQYSTAWAKGKTINSIEIMKILKKADLDRGVSMAFQSLNEESLSATKRKNMSEGTIKKTIDSFTEFNIGVYVELILGLPNETLNSFLDGIFYLFELGHDKFIGVYPLQVLPNTKYADSDYIEKYGLILKETKSHSAYIVPETENSKDMIVIGSNSMPYEDWITAFIYKTLIVGTYTYGSLQYIVKFLREKHYISYENFYKKLYDWCISNEDTVLGKEIFETKKSLDDTINKGSYWNRLIPEIANHTWIHEEALAIKIMENKKYFYDEIFRFVLENFGVKIPQEEKNKQIYGIVDPNLNYPIHVDGKTYSLNWKRKNFNGDFYAWAKECIWWGRKSSRYLTKVS